MAADLYLVNLSAATTKEVVQEHVIDLARNIREQAAQRAAEGLEEELAALWRDGCSQCC